uniref:HydE n=1 Tax=Stygiella incarcerata TaxID=1712417 RepID=A0A192ZIX1_9EUKA|nr:HydE [Stygiella incarcerata]ANM86878.1 HydE [Stygiella incarcerata]
MLSHFLSSLKSSSLSTSVGCGLFGKRWKRWEDIGGVKYDERVDPFRREVGRPQLEKGEDFHMSVDLMEHLLSIQDKAVVDGMFAHAESVQQKNIGNKVHFRGIVEFSNVCRKNCNYCGIRRDMEDVERYTMSKEEILECARWCFQNGYGSIMLQSGERTNRAHLNFLLDVIKSIRKESLELDVEQRQGLGVALSVGEQSKDVYQELFDAGAHRYLLRIETSNPHLYSILHPRDGLHEFEIRLQCIRDLKQVGFQTGTGVMIGLPGQSCRDLANDLMFFRDEDVDMIGMGPYVVQEHTPTGIEYLSRPQITKEELFSLSLRMLALARITLRDVNLPATTALQAIVPNGREIALSCGANMLMPILTPTRYRKEYQLYEGKPCVDEGADECRDCLSNRVKWAGKEIGLWEWGDPKHFFRRTETEEPIIKQKKTTKTDKKEKEKKEH